MNLQINFYDLQKLVINNFIINTLHLFCQISSQNNFQNKVQNSRLSTKCYSALVICQAHHSRFEKGYIYLFFNHLIHFHFTDYKTKLYRDSVTCLYTVAVIDCNKLQCLLKHHTMTPQTQNK